MDAIGAAGPDLTHEVIVPGDGSVMLVLAGDLDLSTTDELDGAVRDALASVSTCLVVDAERLRFADSSAIALWVKWSHAVPKVEIRNAQPLVRRVIEAMGLANRLHLS